MTQKETSRLESKYFQAVKLMYTVYQKNHTMSRFLMVTTHPFEVVVIQ